MNKRKKSHTIKGVRIISTNDKSRDDNTVMKYRLSDEDKKFIDKIYSKKMVGNIDFIGEGFNEI